MLRHHAPTRIALLGLGAVLGASVAACSGTTAAPSLGAACDTFAATPAVSQKVEIKVGDQVTVDLCSNPSTGYTWEDPAIADPSVVALVGSAYQEPGASLPIVGAAGGQVITLKGAAAGTTTVNVAYSRPWEGGEKATWTYTLMVTVR